MLKDFPDFIYRGNGIDLAIGVIMGASFTAIVNSMLGDIFLALIDAIMGVRVRGFRLEMLPCVD